MRAAVLLLALAPTLVLPAAAQDVRPADMERLAYQTEHFGAAMREALEGGSAADVEALRVALSGPAPGGIDPSGEWSCRTIKIGGLVSLVVYTPFRCRIAEIEPGLWQIDKLTGSQRLSGRIEATQAGLVYTGVGFVGERPATDYAGLPDTQEPVEPGQTHAQVGLLEMASPERGRLLLPAPVLESRFDVIELTR